MSDPQLIAARYAMHKCRCKMYGEAVRRGEMGADEAAERYRLAMENFDKMMADAGNGHWSAACEAEMAKGFSLNG
jgi:hypothetical protein